MKIYLHSGLSFFFIKNFFVKALLNSLFKKVCLLLVLLLSISAFLKLSAQTIIDDGNEHFVAYNGSYQDFQIPNNPLVVKIRFRLTGGDGGTASVTVGQTIPLIGFKPIKTCSSEGGTGAIFQATFLVGSESGKIPHGSTVRFIIGDRGVSGHTNTNVIPDGGNGSDYGGGGGGTAVLYRAPGGGTWILLGVAGGGGGGYQGMIAGVCAINEDGGGGRDGENGADGTGFIGGAGIGGSFGAGGGPSSFSTGAGGGGSIYRGGSVSCINVGDLVIADVGEGGAGRDPFDGEVGGYGGSSEGCSSFIHAWRNGGFGYGGGGAGVGVGGGGGGYSGGGAGAIASAGGGGGSFIHFMNETHSITPTGSTESPSSGTARYEVTINQPPVALCKNVIVYLNAGGKASLLVANVNNGSYDPDNTPITYSLSKGIFNCSDIGNNNVILTVTDNHGATSSCTAVVTVIDNIIPIITCLPNITVSCLADVPSVNTGLVTATDNCPVTITHMSDVISNQTCVSRFTLTRTYKATDASGNNASCEQVITVFDDQPPVIINASTNITSLWPANHKMNNVIVNYNSTDNCSAVTTTLSISSNEPLNGTGDGDTSPDWEIVNNHLVKLRAERAGTGNGRIYTITITSIDGCNNASTKVLTVVVNKNNANGAAHTTDLSKAKLKEMDIVDGLQLVATPNPSNNYFNVHIKSNNKQDKMTMEVFDIMGRSVELRVNVQTDAIIQVGQMYKKGAYFIRIMQGKEYKVMKLMKLSD